MIILYKLKEASIEIIKFCSRLPKKYLNNRFENRKYNMVLNSYNSIIFFKTCIYSIVEIIFPNNKRNFRNRQANIYNISTVRDFCKNNNYKYLIVEEEQLRDVCIPHYCNDENEEKIINFQSPEIYIAEIEKANIIGESSFIISGNHCLYDIAKKNKDKRYNLRYSTTKCIDADHAIVESINCNDEKIGQAISLVGFASFNYFHFTIELLSRMQYIDEFKEYDSIPILIDEKALNIPQYKELLDMVNKQNHPIIPIKKSHIYEVEKLIYPSYNSWLPINLEKDEKSRPEDFLIAKSSIEYIRNRILKASKIDLDTLKSHRKIFISRRNVKNKRLINEEKVIEITREFDFEIVYPEELTLIQQIKMFSEADYVIGATGAAFTNIIFCPKNAKIMCIIPKKYNFYGYSTIAKMLDLRCAFLEAEVIKEKQAISMECYRIDIDYYKNYLRKIMPNKKN